MYTRLTLVAGLLFGVMASHIQASLTADAFQAEPPAIAQLMCKQPSGNLRTLSLGTVLATHIDAIPDIILVAAHGLGATTEDCIVTLGESELGIVDIQRGSNRQVHGDWAVLTLAGRFPAAIHRFDWYIDSPNDWEAFATNGGRVSLLRFANGESGTACDVRKPRGGMVDSTDQDTVLLSDCVSIPGMSGAPAIVEVNGRPTVIGLNIGNRYDLSKPPLAWRARANVIRLLDPTMETAIVRAIATALD